MNRNEVYKKASLKFTNATKARTQRMDEQYGSRRMARQAQNDAKRGLSEIDQNLMNMNVKASIPAAELPHEQKLKERLERLKVWREQKAASEQKAKAKKKVPFLVPGVARANKPALAEATTSTLPKPTGRVTRSQTKKTGDFEKQWTVTTNEPACIGKKSTRTVKKEAKSFAPSNFIFSAPIEISQKVLEFQESKAPQTPKASEAEGDDVKISPMLVNNPWITTTRGSSSSKKQRMSVAPASTEDVQSSPMLKQRRESQRNSQINPHAQHFRSLMASEGSRLTDLCNDWEGHLSSDEIPEEEVGSIRTVIGQALLLQRERFTQFAGLVNQFETKTGEKEITPTDLEGFWEMIYLQVLDVDKKFEDLTKLKANGWVKIEEVILKKPKAVAKKKAAPARAAKSNFRAYIAAARKNQLAKSPGSPSVRRSSLLFSPARTPGKRQSLRRSVLLNSAKKPVFIVTDLALGNQQEAVLSPRTPRRVSRRLDVVKDGSPDNELPAVTPKKTYGRSVEMNQSISPEERLSTAFDALKAGSEGLTPVKATTPKAQRLNEDELAFSPRRSVRLRKPAGRDSLLLPTITVSPVPPADDLMSFE